jgi:hypothetical protein
MKKYVNAASFSEPPIFYFFLKWSKFLGSCKGDSGGPLLQLDEETRRWVQIATVQGGLGECGDIDFPG